MIGAMDKYRHGWIDLHVRGVPCRSQPDAHASQRPQPQSDRREHAKAEVFR
jgi:hypothetical protein